MKKFSIASIILIFAFCLFLGAYSFVFEGDDFSAIENRSLKTRSDISFNFLDGEFQQSVEKVMDDQFIFKDKLTTLQNEIEYFLGRRDINEAYICKNFALVQKITDSNVTLSQIKFHSSRYNNFKENLPNMIITAMSIPSAGIALASILPSGAKMFDYENLENEIESAMPDANVIDLLPELFEHEEYYYKTDHHWTALGAYKAYCLWCKNHDLEAIELNEFELTEASDDFAGTLYSKVLLPKIKPDTLYIPKVDENLKITADGKEISFYDMSALQGKDKYNVFMSGNHGTVEIENPSNEAADTLIIIKDSFVNSLVPYLIRHYSKIILIDERYAAVDIASIAKSSGASEIAVIKEAAFF